MTNLANHITNPSALNATLAQLDVIALRTTTHATPLPLSNEQLIRTLVQSPEPRIRETLILLFLRHPQLADQVPAIADTLSSSDRLTLCHFYTAAVYLQCLWQGRLTLYLGAFPLLPNYFGHLWQLPATNEHYGEAGLRILAQHLQQQTGDNWLNTYETTMTRFLTQLALNTHD